MPQLYAFQPRYHGPKSFYVIAESISDAVARIVDFAKLKEYMEYDTRDIDSAYDNKAPGTWTNRTYIITILNPGEVIDNGNS